VPALLGLREPRAAWIWDWRMVVIPVYAAALVWALPQAAKSRAARVLALMTVLAFPIFAFGSLTGGNFAVILPDSGLLTRYLLPLYIPALLGLALFLNAVRPRLRLAFVLVLLAVNLWSVLRTDAVAASRNEFSNQP